MFSDPLAGVPPHLLRAPDNHNVCVISADYRLAPQARFPEILSDCKAAISFVQSPAFASAVSQRVDASKFIISGSSAGGWLALLAGTGIGYAACGLEPPKGMTAIAAIYPITDLEDPFWSTQQRPVSFFHRVIKDEEMKEFVDPNAPAIAAPSIESRRSILYHYMVQEYVVPALSPTKLR